MVLFLQLNQTKLLNQCIKKGKLIKPFYIFYKLYFSIKSLKEAFNLLI